MAKARQLEKSESARSEKSESPASRHEGRVSHSQKWSAMSPNWVTVGVAAKKCKSKGMAPRAQGKLRWGPPSYAVARDDALTIDHWGRNVKSVRGVVQLHRRLQDGAGMVLREMRGRGYEVSQVKHLPLQVCQRPSDLVGRIIKLRLAALARKCGSLAEFAGEEFGKQCGVVRTRSENTVSRSKVGGLCARWNHVKG